MKRNKPLTKETLQNRKAGMDMLHEAAMQGDEIALHTEAIMGLAESAGFGIVNTAADFADEDDGWDDVRPF